MKNNNSQRSGFALYVVIASVLVVALVAGGVLGYASYAMRTTSRFLRVSERRLAAQTVLERAKMGLNEQYRAWYQVNRSVLQALDWFDGWSASQVGGGGFRYTLPAGVSQDGFLVTVTLESVEKTPVITFPASPLMIPPYARLKLRAVAVDEAAGADGDTAAIEESTEFGLKLAGVFDNAYFVDHHGELTDQSIVNGTASSNENIIIDPESLVNGSVSAGGVVDGSTTVDSWDTLEEYWQRASESARPTNPPSYDGIDNPMGYEPPTDEEDQQLYENQEFLEMPFIGDLNDERALASLMGGSLVQGGATIVNAVLGLDQTGPSDVEGAADQGCLIIDGQNGVLQLNGPVVIDRDVVFQGKVQVSGQGTIYAGRNIHILGDIEYVNAPSWPKPDTAPEQTTVDNAAADLMGLVAKGNIVVDAFWNANPWETDVLEMLEARLDASSPPFPCDPTDAPLGYCPPEGAYEFDGNYAAVDGLQKVASITSRRVKIDGRQVVVKTATSEPSKFYESLVYEGMLSASTITRIDAVLYSNHAVFGKIGNVEINGSFVARDDFMTPLNWMEFNWDIRMGSRSLDGLNIPMLLPMVVADPKVVGWKEMLL